MTDGAATVLYAIQAPGGTLVATTPIQTDNTWEIKVITEEPGGATSEVLFHLNSLK